MDTNDKGFARAQRAWDMMEPPWTAAPSGRRWVGEYWTRDDERFEDVEVELDEGDVVAAWCCGEVASAELLQDLEERYEYQ